MVEENKKLLTNQRLLQLVYVDRQIKCKLNFINNSIWPSSCWMKKSQETGFSVDVRKKSEEQTVLSLVGSGRAIFGYGHLWDIGLLFIVWHFDRSES